MRKKLKPMPQFRDEKEEREFWHTHDTTDYFDYAKSRQMEIEFEPGVEAPAQIISLRLPRDMLNDLKVLATKRDVPYQSLIKMFLAAKIQEEKSAA